MRAIIAIEPAIAVAERLVLLQEELADPLRLLGADPVWTRAEEMRLVLGTVELDEQALAHARGLLADAFSRLGPVEFETFGTTFVPSSESPRLVAVGTRGGSAAVGALRGAFEGALSRLGLPADGMEWQPLVRVGRLKTSATSSPLTGVLRPYAETVYGTSVASDVVLSTTSLAGREVRSRLVDRLRLGS